MQHLTNLILVLQGRKTYIITTVGTILNLYLILYPSAVSPSTVLKINGILICLGGAALRAGINKV